MKRWTIIGVALLVLYIASYVSLSFAGGHHRPPRDFIGAVYWWPVGLANQADESGPPALGLLGYLYYPLLTADWAFVHRPFHRC